MFSLVNRRTCVRSSLKRIDGLGTPGPGAPGLGTPGMGNPCLGPPRLGIPGLGSSHTGGIYLYVFRFISALSCRVPYPDGIKLQSLGNFRFRN